MRVRFALAIGSLLLAGGALTGGAVAFAADAPPSVSQPAPQKTGAPAVSPGAPTAAPAPAQRSTAAPKVAAPGQPAKSKRVPTAVPAGPTGDLHLPSVWG
ncbi:hypothetical protein F9C11_04775 [Amycolatopsis sp. VS8301801F10]|uniref:hypothetical protein n=1 Tax=unclassified Amycolatopsis TaxID=2618356 RepID=UPI0038FC1F8A